MRFKEWMELDEAKAKPLRKVLKRSDMPKGKRRHSERVFRTVKSAGGGEDEQLAAFLHDFLERGGDISQLQHLGVSPQTLNVIQHLSDPEKMENEETPDNAPLSHMQSVLDNSEIPLNEKRMVIFIKVADRLDNLMKRVNAGGVSKTYAIKSANLLDYLFSQYNNWFGQDNEINKMYKKYSALNKQIMTQNKKRNLDVPKPWEMEQEPPPEYPSSKNIFTMSA